MRVLIVTGGFITASERSLAAAARKVLTQWRSAEAAWLDLKVKVVAAEQLVGAALERLSGRAAPEARAFMGRRESVDIPELAEVVLGTALAREGLGYEAATLEELFAEPRRRAALLDACPLVFLSSTLLRDLSELEPILRLLAGPGRRIVLGGPLATTLARDGVMPAGVDVLAVGYGEVLVPALAGWARSGFARLEAPEGGVLTALGSGRVLSSGTPHGLSLDHLETPDWAMAARARGRAPYKVVHYESVRGCPYRCAFCNYPFLFDDTRFRYKSAERIASDWERYAAEGAEFVSCLDSLFTVPPKRNRELCALLARRAVPVRWLCYARADDLADLSTAKMMRAAGCVQVQIGLESGDPGVLSNMNKLCAPETNLAALENCRKAGITSVVSLVVGFPGETEATLEATYRHLKAGRPDFFFLATFSTRAAGVPVLSAANRARFGLRAASNPRTVAPYWAHDTMSCAGVGNHVRALARRVMEEELSLDAAMFYGGILAFKPSDRAALLAFQRRALQRHPWNRAVFDAVNAAVDRRLAADVAAWLCAEPVCAPAHEELVHA
ncbi:MAG: radical SAM protein [Elusimicrobia bacterium]|nr:radical SAM protein [Elusimicrobiota bacterium]